MTDMDSFDKRAKCFDEDADKGVKGRCATTTPGKGNCIIDGDDDEFVLEVQNHRLTTIDVESDTETVDGNLRIGSDSKRSFEDRIPPAEPGGWFGNRQPEVNQYPDKVEPEPDADTSEGILTNVDSTILNDELEEVNDSEVRLDISVDIDA